MPTTKIATLNSVDRMTNNVYVSQKEIVEVPKAM